MKAAFALILTLSASAIAAPPHSMSTAQTTLQPQLIRDPFTPSNLMYEMVSTQSLNAGLASGFIPGQGNIDVPKMRLKGFLGETKDDRLALLEINGKNTYMVRVGDEINYDPAHPRSAIRITEINRLSVTVETGVMGTIKILR
jgi:hypothetical protein